MGVPAQPIEDYYGQEPMIGPALDSGSTYTLSGVQSQPFATPLALGNFDPVQDQIANEQAAASIARRGAQQDILSGDTDWASPQGRGKLQDYVARGVVAPTQARAMIYTIPKVVNPNKYSDVPLEVAHAVNRLNQIDPSDPNAMTDLRKVLSDQQVSPDIQTSPYFYPRLKEVQKEILAQKQHAQITGRHDPDEELIGKALGAGVAPEELDPYLGEDGKVSDKNGLRGAMYQASHNSAVLQGENGKRLADLGYATVQPPTDEEKLSWLKDKGITNPTADQWTQAWNGAKQQKLDTYQSYLNFLQQQGYKKLPRGIQQGQQNAPQGIIAAPQAQPQTPAFASEQEAAGAGLPPGSVVIINGRRARID